MPNGECGLGQKKTGYKGTFHNENIFIECRKQQKMADSSNFF